MTGGRSLKVAAYLLPTAKSLSGGRDLATRTLSLLRKTAREELPFDMRVALRRWPATARWLATPPALKKLPPSAFSHVQTTRTSPLRRPGTTYSEPLQQAKEANVLRAAKGLTGIVVPAGESFSWHETLGPPLKIRGFELGPELHEGVLAQGVGGGLCQVANMVYWLAITAGMDVVERHRHGLDLFPDSSRDVPFGCGATVFHPLRDLKFLNPLSVDFLLELSIESGQLVGRGRMASDPGTRWEVVETHHQFRRVGEQIWRENSLARRVVPTDGPARLEPLTTNRARVLYPVAEAER